MTELNRMQKLAIEILKDKDLAANIKVSKGSSFTRQGDGVTSIKIKRILGGVEQASEVAAALSAICADFQLQNCSSVKVSHGAESSYEVSIWNGGSDGEIQLRNVATLMADQGVNFPGSEGYKSKTNTHP